MASIDGVHRIREAYLNSVRENRVTLVRCACDVGPVGRRRRASEVHCDLPVP
jgi:hypothetical protein